MGRRELNKRATREALEQAAKQLFAERGFAATTVRDIADAAGVTERTFFRYFAGKEELILDDVLAGLPLLQTAIVTRPAEEAPLVAVARAIGALLRLPRTGTGTSPLLLFTDGRPGGAGRAVGAGLPAARRGEPRPQHCASGSAPAPNRPCGPSSLPGPRSRSSGR